MKKHIVALTLIFFMLMSFWGCGKKEENKPETTTASKEYVYRMEDIAIGTEEQNLNRIIRAGEAIYAYGYAWSDRTFNFYKLNEDGTVGGEYHIPLEENNSLNSIVMDDDANIYCIRNDFHPVNEDAYLEDEKYAGDEEEYVDDYYFTKMDLSGEELFSVKLNDLLDADYFYVSDIILDKEKGIYLHMDNGFVKFDFDGNFLENIEPDEESNSLDSASFISLSDGRKAAVLHEDSGIFIALVDLEKCSVGEKYSIPGVSYQYSYYAGNGYDLYLVDNYGIYGYNLGDTDKTQLMSCIDSDIDVYNLRQVTGVGDKDFLTMYDSMETGYSMIAKLTKVPPEEVKEKQLITLAMGETDWGVRRSVIKFNKENDDYRISILDYSSLYGTDDDYRAGINRLNTDIASGKVPDIILLNNAMPVDSYISKGLFEDLKPYINQDEELELDNFMPNIIEAFSTNGKMYTMVPSYSIQTLVAKTSEVGDERGWTVQEALDLLSSKPEGTQLLLDITRNVALQYCLTMSGNQFINWESGTCSFNSDEFIQMLKFIEMFPEEIDYEMYDEEYWNNYSSMWREGKVLADVNTFGDFDGFCHQEKGVFGEDITMIGFPSSNGDGSVIVPGLQLALSAKSGNKEGAWTFLRTFLTDAYQEENINYYFPLSIKRLNELADRAMERPYYLDENGDKVEYDNLYYAGEEEIILPPLTRQETDEFVEELYSFTQVYKFDETLFNIIEEELAPYFAGQKSAENVASIIQSRVQIYVNETR